MSKTIAIHVRFESCYISLLPSATQQRETTKFYVFWRTRAAMANFSCLPLELNVFSHEHLSLPIDLGANGFTVIQLSNKLSVIDSCGADIQGTEIIRLIFI